MNRDYFNQNEIDDLGPIKECINKDIEACETIYHHKFLPLQNNKRPEGNKEPDYIKIYETFMDKVNIIKSELVRHPSLERKFANRLYILESYSSTMLNVIGHSFAQSLHQHPKHAESRHQLNHTGFFAHAPQPQQLIYQPSPKSLR